MNNGETNEIIIGKHSINEALVNPHRKNLVLYVTDEVDKEIIKKSANVKTIKLSSHALQEKAKELFKEAAYEYVRIPSSCLLVTEVLEEESIILRQLENFEFDKILCLDQITDVNNAAAIVRTSSFYGIGLVVVPSKRTFRKSPSFYRISSGAAEHVKILPVNSMAKFVNKVSKLGFQTIALSEHEDEGLQRSDIAEKACLVVGNEMSGVSNAVLLASQKRLSLKSQGNILSLNVSVATAVALEKCFGIN